MWQGTSVRPQRQLKVTKPDTRPEGGHKRLRINADILEVLRVDDQLASGCAVGGIGVASGPSLHFDLVLGRAEDGIGDVFSALGKDDDDWFILDSKIVGCREIGELLVRGGNKRYGFGFEAVDGGLRPSEIERLLSSCEWNWDKTQ